MCLYKDVINIYVQNLNFTFRMSICNAFIYTENPKKQQNKTIYLKIRYKNFQNIDLLCEKIGGVFVT